MVSSKRWVATMAAWARVAVCGLWVVLSVVVWVGLAGECWAKDGEQSRGALAAVLRGRVQVEQAWEDLPSGEEIERQTQVMLAGPLGVDDAVRIALLNYRGLRADLQQLEIARALAFQKVKPTNPSLEGSVWFDKDGLGEIDASLMFDVASLIRFYGIRKGANQEFAIARLEAGAVVIAFVEEVRVAYYAYVAAEKMGRIAEQLDAAAQASAKAASLLFDAGNVTEYELVTQRALAADVRGALQETRAARQSSRQRLQLLLGIDHDASWSVSEDVSEFWVPTEDVQALQERAVGQSLRVQKLRMRQELSKTHARVNNWQDWLPTLEIGVSGELDFGDTNQLLIGPTIKIAIPMFQSPAPFEAQIVRAELASRNEVRAIALLVSDLYGQLQLAGERVRYFKEQVLPLRAQVVEQAQLQFHAGGIDVFELVSARQAQIQAEREYVRVLQRGWLLSAQMETLMAGGRPGAQVSSERIKEPISNSTENGQ